MFTEAPTFSLVLIQIQVKELHKAIKMKFYNLYFQVISEGKTKIILLAKNIFKNILQSFKISIEGK